MLAGIVRGRDGGSFFAGTNAENIALKAFTAAYQSPLAGDLRVIGDVSAWVDGAAARDDVQDDYCARERPDGQVTLGALEHSLGDCETNPPPFGETSGAGGGAAGSGGQGAGGDGEGAGNADGGGPGGDGGATGAGGDTSSPASGPGSTTQTSTSSAGGDGAGAGAVEGDGCGCRLVGEAPVARGRTGGAFALLALGLLGLARRRRSY